MRVECSTKEFAPPMLTPLLDTGQMLPPKHGNISPFRKERRQETYGGNKNTRDYLKPKRGRINCRYCGHPHRHGNHRRTQTHFIRQPLHVALDEIGDGLVSHPGRLRGCVMRPELCIHLSEVVVSVRHGGLYLLLHDFHEGGPVRCLRGVEDGLVDHLEDKE